MKPGERYSIKFRWRRILGDLTGKRRARLCELRIERKRKQASRDVRDTIRTLEELRDKLPPGHRDRLTITNEIFQVRMMALMAGL